MKRNFIFLVFDIVFVVLSFLFLVWLKDSSKTIIKAYSQPFLIFLAVWLFTSLITRKYAFSRFRNFKSITSSILVSNLSVVAVVSVMMFSFNQFEYSRMLVFGTVLITTIIEISGAAILNLVIKTPVVEFENGAGKPDSDAGSYQAVKKRRKKDRDNIYPGKDFKALSGALLDIIEEENSREVRALIEKYSKISNGVIKVVSTTTRFNILSLSQKSYGCLINLQRVNDFQYINKFFEAVNSKLGIQGIFIGKAETFSLRKNHILSAYPFPLNYLIYIIDFIFKRIFPKVPGLKKMYFWLTKGRNRLISRAETLGRLYSCGFEVLDEQFIDDELYFVARKTGEPLYPQSPTYGPLIKLNRVGKHGKMFRVYKMRTMHPFAEYLQPYIYKKYKLQRGGKFKDDFRVSTLGKIMRKVWIDELPMLINIFRGNMKIVGVRPLSKHYFSLYTKELQQKRTQFKPGLIPPFYADMPETLDEIMASEMKYLVEYEKNPLKTDLKYFLAAWKNIIFKRARSN
jgi:lipopolysaccharide/colanic/teichoic acid biosynthesis glycosyltransferase